MMVHLYDYAVPVADPVAGVPSLRDALSGLEVSDRKAVLSGLFRPERMPGTMERLSTLVADVDASFADLLTLLDNSARVRKFVAIDEAKALIKQNVQSLAAAVREGREIVVPGPTCSYMLKQDYPWLDGSDDAKLVAANTRDIFEYLAKLQAAGQLDTNFTRPIGNVTYHVPCHLRAQNLGHKSADVLRAVPGAAVDVVEKCSAVDGTWGFKKEYYELSLKVAKPLFDAVAAGAPTVATDCPLAALQIEQGTGRKAKHPIEILAAAYGLEE